jgi:hypothetical protein
VSLPGVEPLRVRKVNRGPDAQAALERFVDWERTLSAASEPSNGRTWPRVTSGADSWWVTMPPVLAPTVRTSLWQRRVRTDSRDATPDPIRAESTPLCDTHDQARVAKLDNYAMEWPESYGIQAARSQSGMSVGFMLAAAFVFLIRSMALSLDLTGQICRN